MLFDDWVLIRDNLYCLCSIKVLECFCFIRDVFHDSVTWCAAQCRSIFMVFLFLDRFFHGAFPGAPLKFANLLWCHQLPLQLHDSTLQVRLFIVSVCLCVWVYQSVMINLFVLELVSQFWSFYTLLLICFGCESVGLTMQISPFLNGKVFMRLLFLWFLVDQIGHISHAWFLWEPLCLADLWLIAQLSLLFLYYVFVIEVCHFNNVIAIMLSWKFLCWSFVRFIFGCLVSLCVTCHLLIGLLLYPRCLGVVLFS